MTQSLRQTAVFHPTIAVAGDTSSAVTTAGSAAGCIRMPAAMVGTKLDVYESPDGNNFQSLLREDGTAVSVTFVASSTIFLPPECFACQFIKFKSDATETAGAAYTVSVSS